MYSHNHIHARIRRQCIPKNLFVYVRNLGKLCHFGIYGLFQSFLHSLKFGLITTRTTASYYRWVSLRAASLAAFTQG